jgi:hypothetical protein
MYTFFAYNWVFCVLTFITVGIHVHSTFFLRTAKINVYSRQVLRMLSASLQELPSAVTSTVSGDGGPFLFYQRYSSR